MPSVQYTQKDSGDFLFGLSLAELIIILFFVLALLFLFLLKKQMDRINKTTDEAQACSVELEERETQLKAYSTADNRTNVNCESELIVMKRNVDQYKQTIGRQRKKITELEEEKLTLMQKAAAQKKLDKKLEKAGVTPEKLDDLLAMAKKNKEENLPKLLKNLKDKTSELEKENKKLREEVEKLRLDEPVEIQRDEKSMEELLALNESLEEENKDCLARTASQNKKLKKCGFGPPPCWERSNGQPDYIFKVTVSNDGYKVERAYSKLREVAASKIAGVKKLEGRFHSVNEFSAQSNLILQWSKERNCRHWVVVYDTDETTKQTYKRRLKRLQSYYYKYEPN